MTQKLIHNLTFLALEEAPVIAGVYDLAGELVFANRAFREAAGVDEVGPIARKCHVIWGLAEPCAGCPIREVLRTGRPAEVELNPETQKDWPAEKGSWHCQASPLFDDGVLIGAVSVAVDISRRARAVSELSQQARRQRMIIDILQFPDRNLQLFLDHALNRAIDLTESRIGYIYFYDEETRQFTLNSWSRDVMKECTVVNPQTKYDLDRTGIWGEAVRQRRAIRVNDFARPDPLKKGVPEGHVRLSRFLTVPVFDRERIVAVVGVANKGSDYDETDELQLTLLMEAVWKSVGIIEGREALGRSMEQVRALVESLPDVVMRFDREGRHLFVSENVEVATGIPAGRFLGLTHRQMGFPEHLCVIWERALEQVIRDGASLETEFSFAGAGGEVFYEWRLVPERDAEGVIQSVVTVARDVTRQRQSEEDYELLFKEMLDAFAVHEILLDATGRPINYRFLSVNPAFEQMTGLHAADILGKTVLEVLPGLELHWIETYGRVALTGEPANFENYSSELKKYYEVKAFRTAPGKFACIFTDVTSRKRAEQEREKLAEQLAQSQKMESIGRLAGGVAHDFNNMLNIILSNAEMAIEDVPLFSSSHEAISQIQKAARRSAALTAQLLAFARKQPVTPQRLELNERVEGMLKLLRRLIGEDMELIFLPGPESGAILIDPSQLDQILANLCVNARDAIDGTGRITISTETVHLTELDCSQAGEVVPGTYVVLKVTDTGRGMDAEILSHLFEPFFTTKGLGKGTGLGLATVHGIVSQNNGYVCVRSEVGKGSVFRIFLPRQEPTQRKSSPELVPVDVFGSETILLVEDEPEILHVARRILERHGYRVLIASTPAEALRHASEHGAEIHLLVTDVIMPEMNGRDLSQKLAALVPGLKCLFMSGYTADYIASHGVLDKGVHFLQKPFSKKAFTTLVREVLDQGT